MENFVHLHLHTQYSVLDGANKISELVKHVSAKGQQAVAMTDHGNMHGALEFYQSAKQSGIKPIVGCEVYMTAGSRFDRTSRAQGGAGIHHLTLLCMNRRGYQNLCRLVTQAHTEGFYFKPRIDFELLSECHEGLLCLSGCMSSEFSLPAKASDEKSAQVVAERYAGVFGDRYYLEVQPHAIKEQQSINEIARHLSQKLGISMVATNDCHYLSPDHHLAQEVLMCISTGKLLSDQDRLRHDGLSLHLKSRDEMLAEMPEFEEAIDATVSIASRCDLEFDLSKHYMPQFDPPAGQTIEECFAEHARTGLVERLSHAASLGEKLDEVAYRALLEEEIGIIIEMGFAGYFLVVSDFILWAKRNSVPVGPGRGSAAGSLVAFAMFITEIDPIKYKLLFERFLNPERVSLPDIDVDFCIYGREKVIEYVTDKYGRDKVAQIATFGTLKAKAAIKDVGRVLGLSYAETDRIAKLVPAPRQGFDYPLAEAMKMEKRLEEYAKGEGKELIDLALKLEGLSRHTSTHAAGLVISDRPIVEHLPLLLDKDGQVVTQFSMNWVEKIGLVKFDFLGLKTLSVIQRALDLIRKHEGVDIKLNDLPLGDVPTYRMISLGRTIGVFQLESSGITEMVRRLKPNCFEDVVAILALYRPGPLDAGMVDHYINRKHGREKVVYLHPMLAPILKDTYGIILYQEQIMQIARDMGGYSLGGADMLRRVMGKKKPEEMAKHRDLFVSGSKKNGVADKLAQEVFDQMETFARYGFNRSHSVAYAMISFQTAYLKAHYQTCFMAALMSFEMSDTDKTLKNLNECRELSVPIAPPDVNAGDIGFTVADKKVVFGLAALKGVGEKAVTGIIEERDKGGVFKSLADFCLRIESGALNRRSLESLICAGAFDWTGVPRAELTEQIDDVLKFAQRVKDDRKSRQLSLFAALEGHGDAVFASDRAPLPEWPSSKKLSKEKEALGFYLSGHPLEQYRHDITQIGAQNISAVESSSDGAEVRLAGVVTFLRLKNTKKGDRYATFVLEDQMGTVETIVWPDVYKKISEFLSQDDPVLVTGRVDVSDERRSLMASDVCSLLEASKQSAREVLLRLNTENCSPKKLAELKHLLKSNTGACQVKLVVSPFNHCEMVIALAGDLKVSPDENLRNGIEEIFGDKVFAVR